MPQDTSSSSSLSQTTVCTTLGGSGVAGSLKRKISSILNHLGQTEASTTTGTFSVTGWLKKEDRDIHRDAWGVLTH